MEDELFDREKFKNLCKLCEPAEEGQERLDRKNIKLSIITLGLTRDDLKQKMKDALDKEVVTEV